MLLPRARRTARIAAALLLSACAAGVALATSACERSKPASHDPVEQGQELFTVACVRCHGPEGRGGPPGPLGQPPPRDFTDPAFQARVSDEDIGRTIRNGRKGMPAFGAVFAPEQVNVLVARVRRFGPPRLADAGSDRD